MTVQTLIEHFNWVIQGSKFHTEAIWNGVVAASAQGQAIESAAHPLKGPKYGRPAGSPLQRDALGGVGGRL